MSKTGTYVYRDGKVVKVSDRTPSLGFVTEANIGRLKGQHHRAFTTEHVTGKSEEFRTRRELHAAMRKHGVRPVGDEKRDFSRPQIQTPDPRKTKDRIAQEVEKAIQKGGLRVPG